MLDIRRGFLEDCVSDVFAQGPVRLELFLGERLLEVGRLVGEAGALRAYC